MPWHISPRNIRARSWASGRPTTFGCLGQAWCLATPKTADGLARLFAKHRFAAVLDCAGNCASGSAKWLPELAWRINVEGVRNLLSQTRSPRSAAGTLVVRPGVFRRRRPRRLRRNRSHRPGYRLWPDDGGRRRGHPGGRPRACILRISLPMGVSFSGHAGAIDWIASRFKKSRPATLYLDEIRTPTYTDCLNRLCETMLVGELCGIYHAGGRRRLSLYQIAQIINRVGGYDPDCLMGIPRFQAGPIPPRAGNVCMDCAQAHHRAGRRSVRPVALLRRARAYAPTIGTANVHAASRTRRNNCTACWPPTRTSRPKPHNRHISRPSPTMKAVPASAATARQSNWKEPTATRHGRAARRERVPEFHRRRRLRRG